MSKHTPGPFRFDDSGPNSGNVVRGEIVGPKGQHIADVLCSTPGDTGIKRASEVEANGRLLASAPDLLAACEELFKTMRQYDMDVEGDPPPMHREMMDRARAAIQKARGEA